MDHNANHGPGGEDDSPQPATAYMDEQLALWYVAFTRNQFQAHQRNGRWYLSMPGSTTEKPLPTDESGGVPPRPASDPTIATETL
jgi:hypothetical protein